VEALAEKQSQIEGPGPWRSEKWWVSNLNFRDDVRDSFQLPEQLIFHDVTLRDGEQTPGVVFRKDEKARIARKLDDIGVQRIEAGFPMVSEEDREAVKEIAGLGLSAKVLAMVRMSEKDIDAALECGVWGVVCEGPTSQIQLKYRYNWSREELLQRASQSVSYAKDRGLYVCFMGVDSTRTEPEFTIRLAKALADVGLDSFAITDSFCTVLPHVFAYLVKRVREALDVPVEVHCHNELGLATANSLAGIGAGAQVVHATVNGIGEKTGNAALEEIALAARLLYGMDSGLSYEKMYELSKLVEELSGFRIALNKPIVGDYAFARESGLAVWAWLRHSLGLQSYEPDLVGNRVKVLLGKKSGRASIRYQLEQLGISSTEDQVKEMVRLVKSRGIEKKGLVSEDEFREIADSATQGC
jgi:isopropylmalate/homocitrate/citramalate synthase